jgi:hypothetical protein
MLEGIGLATRKGAALRRLCDAPARNRTLNLRIKSPLLCQLSYRGAANMVAAAARPPLAEPGVSRWTTSVAPASP